MWRVGPPPRSVSFRVTRDIFCHDVGGGAGVGFLWREGGSLKMRRAFHSKPERRIWGAPRRYTMGWGSCCGTGKSSYATVPSLEISQVKGDGRGSSRSPRRSSSGGSCAQSLAFLWGVEKKPASSRARGYPRYFGKCYTDNARHLHTSVVRFACFESPRYFLLTLDFLLSTIAHVQVRGPEIAPSLLESE